MTRLHEGNDWLIVIFFRSSDPKKHCYFQCDYVETVSDYTDDIDLKPYNQLFAFFV